MARVVVLREVRHGDSGEWQLCFHWCRYLLDDDPVQYGYRFVWRRKEDGSIQAARGQARIPNYWVAEDLMKMAKDAKWGDRDGDEIVAAAKRLREAGCEVDLGSGHVKWPTGGDAARSEQNVADARLINEWTH